MKTKYQYIHFDKDVYNIANWYCRNNKSGKTLGEIRWYPSWKQYCYFPLEPVVYSTGCLEDIIHFMKQISNVEADDDEFGTIIKRW